MAVRAGADQRCIFAAKVTICIKQTVSEDRLRKSCGILCSCSRVPTFRAFRELGFHVPIPVGILWRAARIKVRFFLSYPQEISPLHSFYTVEPQFAVALIFLLPQSACSQKRAMFFRPRERRQAERPR